MAAPRTPGDRRLRAIALVTAAVPAVTCVILISQQVIGAGDVGAVLTGYVLAAPVPALVACALRPALINAGLNAMLGSTVLLLAAVPCVVLGGPRRKCGGVDRCPDQRGRTHLAPPPTSIRSSARGTTGGERLDRFGLPGAARRLPG